MSDRRVSQLIPVHNAMHNALIEIRKYCEEPPKRILGAIGMMGASLDILLAAMLLDKGDPKEVAGIPDQILDAWDRVAKMLPIDDDAKNFLDELNPDEEHGED